MRANEKWHSELCGDLLSVGIDFNADSNKNARLQSQTFTIWKKKHRDNNRQLMLQSHVFGNWNVRTAKLDCAQIEQ